MSRPFSFVGYQEGANIRGVEVSLPIDIIEMAETLSAYASRPAVIALVQKGHVSYLEPTISESRFKDTYIGEHMDFKRTDIQRIMTAYPYVYLYDTETQTWYFHHRQSPNYTHHSRIPLKQALLLQRKGELFKI